ncbi:MAG: HAMP domain-containing sensor histidine kinase [Planctomycetota bacterium]
MRLSIGRSLFLWVVGSTVLLLVLFSLALYLIVGRALYQGLDDRLETLAQGMVALCEWEEDRGAVCFEAADEPRGPLAEAGRIAAVELRSWPDGAVVHRSGAALPEPAATGGLRAGAASFTDLGDGLRLCTLLVTVPTALDADGEGATPGFSVLARVAEPLAPLQAQLADLLLWVLLSVAIAAVVVVAFGRLLSRRFVRPLGELAEAAASLRGGDRARLPRSGTDDELDRLAGLLDDGIERLEAAAERQARFTADAAHELRNPISVIHNAASVALRNPRDPADYRAFLEDVLGTARRMGGIVDGLLLMARMDAGAARQAFDDCDLAAIAAEAAAADPARVHVAAGGPARLRGDARLLRILVDNLVANALRHSEGGVHVEVEADAAGAVVLRVRDAGPGIPPEQAERVFERFHRGAEARSDDGGAGLGLAIVAEIARLHGGGCQLAPGTGGTTVVVRLGRG